MKHQDIMQGELYYSTIYLEHKKI